ncbi:hypothetical protein DCC81_24765 [Chitinophaga parva]|uniref:Head-tail adaptor protein n=1 Tax=Chitinophaga parva TaxID=2169414 RepID=A0A2T7BBQ2_9BACT|nr:phage head closure protein [Chitinophaga parva]PUZ21803.1 hypothetical protein DCC81_24765 [Chitinophaga parva]
MSKIRPLSDFNRKVSAQKLTVTQDDAGGEVPTWTTVYDTWAAVRGVRSKRTQEEAQTENNRSYELQLRYAQGREVSKNIRFLYDGQILTVNEYQQYQEGNKRFWVIIAVTNE